MECTNLELRQATEKYQDSKYASLEDTDMVELKAFLVLIMNSFNNTPLQNRKHFEIYLYTLCVFLSLITAKASIQQVQAMKI